ncbi:OmpW family outer membrane protein, partial [Shewanella sp. 0m-11]
MMNKKIVSSLIATALLTTGFASSVSAHQAGDIIVRAGVAVVAPNESSPVVADVAEFSVSDNTQLGLNFGYMITDNIGIELLAATPFSHDISLGSLGKIAETKHLPPTLVVQYYFGDAQSKLRPYIGAGVNFTNFYDNEFTQ